MLYVESALENLPCTKVVHLVFGQLQLLKRHHLYEAEIYFPTGDCNQTSLCSLARQGVQVLSRPTPGPTAHAFVRSKGDDRHQSSSFQTLHIVDSLVTKLFHRLHRVRPWICDVWGP